MTVMPSLVSLERASVSPGRAHGGSSTTQPLALHYNNSDRVLAGIDKFQSFHQGAVNHIFNYMYHLL